MLNINKIHSLINKGENTAASVSRGTGIIYSSFKSKLKSGSWTPDDVEKIADYFGKSILYFFDREEPETHPVLNEVQKDYKITRVDCPVCIEKQKEIDRLNDQLKDKNELLDFYRDKKKEAS